MDNRALFITTMTELLEAQGYYATGIKEVVQKSAAPIGSLYHYFPGGKEELALLAIEQAGAAISKQLAAVLNGTVNPPDKIHLGVAIEQIFAFFADQLQKSAFQKGCPIATVTLETAAFNPKLQQACQQVYQSWRQTIEQALLASGYKMERAQPLATFILAAFEGALLLSRAENNTQPLQQVAMELKTFFTLIEK